jgi:hypothetical protein
MCLIKEADMYKLLAVIIFTVLIAGCIAHLTPEGTFLEPLPVSVVIGPPVVITSPTHIVLGPLPPVVVVPDRHFYFHNYLYYYYWENEWYYSDRDRGPWHRLPREHYPKQYRHSDRDRNRGRH